jgi:hypothetical protein
MSIAWHAYPKGGYLAKMKIRNNSGKKSDGQ